MKIGCRAHDFGRRPPEELARLIAAHPFNCVQLAPSKAFPDIEWRSGGLTPAFAARAAEAFSACGVDIAVLGCYVNPIHPDRGVRRELLEIFKEHLRVARAFGCGVVALETGSLNADYSPHPDNHSEAAFQELVASISELVEAAEAADVLVGVEAVTVHTIFKPTLMRRLLDEVPSDHIGVVHDPVNLLDAGNWRAQGRIFEEAFDLYGDKIVALHAKDFTVSEGGLKYRALGKGGMLDAGSAFSWIAKHKPDVPVLLEEIDEQTVFETLETGGRIFNHETTSIPWG
jgi:sugar phosphate isomerase/epimerase